MPRGTAFFVLCAAHCLHSHLGHMATRTEANLHLVGAAREALDKTSDGAQRTTEQSIESDDVGASSAPAEAALDVAIAGYHDALTYSWKSPSVIIDAEQLFVAPETVRAIEKAKAAQQEEEAVPTVEAKATGSGPWHEF